jgi:hypothetical protein
MAHSLTLSILGLIAILGLCGYSAGLMYIHARMDSVMGTLTYRAVLKEDKAREPLVRAARTLHAEPSLTALEASLTRLSQAGEPSWCVAEEQVDLYEGRSPSLMSVVLLVSVGFCLCLNTVVMFH